MSFTAAERAILDWFAEHSADAKLRAQIAAATPGEREVTSVGFFTELLLPPESAEAECSLGEGQVALEGCALLAPELDPMANCLLHTRNGKIGSLEVYAVADGHPLHITSFQVTHVHGNMVDLRPDGDV
jgi:hypothetical protein